MRGFSLNALDARAGDGDTDSTVAGAARVLKSNLKKMPRANRGAFLTAASEIFFRDMGGSSGILMAILFSTAGRDEGTWQSALQGVADPGAEAVALLFEGLAQST